MKAQNIRAFLRGCENVGGLFCKKKKILDLQVN